MVNLQALKQAWALKDKSWPEPGKTNIIPISAARVQFYFLLLSRIFTSPFQQALVTHRHTPHSHPRQNWAFVEKASHGNACTAHEPSQGTAF